MPLIGAAALFALFAVNVAMGAFFGGSFLGDIGELLVLLATTILFVIAIIKKEADAEK